ncbi:MAG: hypothetical protein INR71_00345 [Terriglobus roseus]|nr:hypothetical protein [Terriglobus roseus]
MGYNTRRKSLSLPSLGIQLPHGSRAANRSPPATTTTTTTTTSTSAASPPPQTHPSDSQAAMPPAKKVKRSHTSGSLSPSPTSPGRATSAARGDAATPARMAENTPPPSPGAYTNQKVDTRGIDDEIVVAVIEQLERTGNKPHLLKELAAVLSTQLAIVQRYGPGTTSTTSSHARRGHTSRRYCKKNKKANTPRSSANQSAIISSRLTSYLRRPWSALSPCPVGKELIGTHPKRIYFFLTTCEHQEFPDPEEVNAQNAQARAAARIITPSLSSNGGSAAGSHSGEEAQDEKRRRSRQQLSPSPELDLSMHETDLIDNSNLPFDLDMDLDLDPDVASLTRTFSGRNSLSREQSHRPSDTRRAVSPPLEGDEREFTRTASELQALAQRKRVEEEQERERRASRELSQASGSVSAASSTGAPATPASAGASEDDVDIKMELSTPDLLDGHDDEATNGLVVVVDEDESEEACALRNSECAKELFGDAGVGMLSLASPLVKSVHFNISSPLVKPAVSVNVGAGKPQSVGWSELELKSPENVDLDELDVLFDSY